MKVGPVSTQQIPPSVESNGKLVRLAGPFTYTLGWNQLAAAAAGTPQQFQVQGNTDFLWLGTSYLATIADAAQTRSSLVVPLVMQSITLTNEPFEDAETPLTGLAGSPEEGPRPLASGFWMPGGSTFKMTARNFTQDATVYNLWVVFHGAKYLKEE